MKFRRRVQVAAAALWQWRDGTALQGLVVIQTIWGEKLPM